ncbi:MULTISPECIES: permease-like cell division protein FtsX [unclassified Corynebacterium]|uniref:permease-like cell division protein FtsX n=1 Tax=unclassified Corynebacterium TaxID=2624378 RepID=UPI0029CA0DB0|nr:MULTISPECIES: permease-like cell division protein FtsX [unclassified Corynebacterium]WPF66718.1 permease-like cell division protein FtsX [Corynebacterium sp. 22KM0430]WPF69206.1 permease-like cell division protein FtsX [Corynebacterium sp. 21KM1197]
MNTGFVLREATKGLARNITMTIALVITTAISLALLATGFLVTNMTSETKEIYLDRVEVMIQLDEDISSGDEDCSSEECQEVYSALDGAEGVESVKYRSREQSYERFVEVFQDTDPELVKDTDKDALPAALHVRLTDPLDTAPLAAVEDMPQVAEIVDQVDDLRGATDNLDSVRNATFLLAAVQAVAAIFLIANMVQIAAYNRRDEMAIMRMVGASRWYTQAPFILEAVAATLIGAVFSTIGLFLGKTFVVDKALSGLYEAKLIAPITSSDIWLVVPGVVLVGVIFAALTAQITLRAYVRK